MLSNAKNLLEKKLYKILFDSYASQFLNNSEAGKYNNISKKNIDDSADAFAKIASKSAADAIYKFVKEIGININIPPTVISPIIPGLPGGPCTGLIPYSNINIL